MGKITVSPVEVRDLGEPEAVVTYPLGASCQVRLAGTVVTRHLRVAGGNAINSETVVRLVEDALRPQPRQPRQQQ